VCEQAARIDHTLRQTGLLLRSTKRTRALDPGREHAPRRAVQIALRTGIGFGTARETSPEDVETAAFFAELTAWIPNAMLLEECLGAREIAGFDRIGRSGQQAELGEERVLSAAFSCAARARRAAWVT
jgi:hypothetical protein